ncbi:MAG: TetR/AcrR family transcriptional regulator [Candidatus Aminicenantales bacterium]
MEKIKKEKKDLRRERKRRRLEANRRFIIEIAERMFSERGYSSTSMDDIAAEAQFSKATIYRYFSSKGKLFLEIILNSMEELKLKFQKIIWERATADRRLAMVIRTMIEHLKEKENISRVFFVDKLLREKLHFVVTANRRTVPVTEKEFSRKIKEKRRELLSAMEEIIRSGVRSGEFRPLKPKEAAVVIESLVYGFFYGRHWHWKDATYDLEKGIDIIHKFLLHGMKKREIEHKGVRR